MAARKKPGVPDATSGDFDSLVSSIVRLHQQTQDIATKAVNVTLTLRNWLIGHRIVEFEQKGHDRAAYGERLMDALSQRLVPQGLNRATPRELRRFRQFYQAYPHIWESATPKSLAETGLVGFDSLLPTARSPIRESVTPESQSVETLSPQLLLPHPELILRLSFTHLAEIISLDDETQRRFYEIECIRGNWSVRELKRQIVSLYYQRSGLSQDKAALSRLTHQTAATALPAHIIRNPYKTDAFRHEHLGQLNTYVAYYSSVRLN